MSWIWDQLEWTRWKINENTELGVRKSYTRSKKATKENDPTDKRKTSCIILLEVRWSLQITHVVDYYRFQNQTL